MFGHIRDSGGFIRVYQELNTCLCSTQTVVVRVLVGGFLSYPNQMYLLQKEREEKVNLIFEMYVLCYLITLALCKIN